MAIYNNCTECADQYDVNDMHQYANGYICQPCLDKAFVLQEVK